LDSTARGIVFIGSGAFLGPALLRLAREAAMASCTGGDSSSSSNAAAANASATNATSCDGNGDEPRVYGIRPSSLLTTYTTVVGIASCVLLPLVGAVVDAAPHRRLLGRVFSFVFCLLVFPQIFLSSSTWFAVAVLHLLEAVVGWAQTLLAYSYLPELTDSEIELASFAQSFTVVNYASMVLYLALVVGISSVSSIRGDLVATAQLGQAVSFGASSILLLFAWGCGGEPGPTTPAKRCRFPRGLFRTRPAAHGRPESAHSLWTSGFVQVYRTARMLHRSYRALLWFLVSVALVDAAVQSLITIAITYLTDTLEFDSTENGIAVLAMLLGSVPGGFVGGRTIRWINPIRSGILATLVLAINTIVAAVVLTGPGQQLVTYGLALVWGLGTGWKWTADKSLVSSTVPDGQDAELMGLYLFSGQALTWVPPLVYTALNESGAGPRVGIGTLSAYFAAGVVALACMGNYRDAVELAGRVRLAEGGGGHDGDDDRAVTAAAADPETLLIGAPDEPKLEAPHQPLEMQTLEHFPDAEKDGRPVAVRATNLGGGFASGPAGAEPREEEEHQ
jgi:MFS-type transporter involved in bile tolerance (Atg22 family)